MPNTIKVKRGKSAALNTSTEKLQAGEVLYNLDKNYLTVGAEDNDALTKKPVAAREIVGYTGDTDSKIGASTTEAYSIRYNDDSGVVVSSKNNTLSTPGTLKMQTLGKNASTVIISTGEVDPDGSAKPTIELSTSLSMPITLALPWKSGTLATTDDITASASTKLDNTNEDRVALKNNKSLSYTSEATASTIMSRDANGRVRVADGVADKDIATVGQLNAGLNDKYTKPTGGIPKSDLASAVQASLEKADSALQSHQSITTGSVNGTIAANGTDVAVKGLGSLAYKNALTKTDVGLGNVDNTSDEEKPISTATQAALDKKQASLTATQLNAVNSGITSGKVSTYDGYQAKIDDKYTKPTGGIPETDLAGDVQTSLAKANSALQSHQTVKLESGTNNGTLKLTVNGTATDNIAVKNLGSAAFTAASNYATAAELGNYYTKTQSDGRYVKSSENFVKVFTIPNGASSGTLTADVKQKLCNPDGHNYYVFDDTSQMILKYSFNADDEIIQYKAIYLQTDKAYEITMQILPSNGSWRRSQTVLNGATANPTLTGTEAELTGLKVGGTNYKIPGKLSDAQLEAVNSGITAGKVSTYDGYQSQISDKYTKPSGGIPETDLASEVQASLDKADSALQYHQSITTGSVNGTISVGGTNVSVKGLGSLAYKNALTKSDVGLGNVDNTSDEAKPISTATQAALNGKVNTTRTVNGHALSSNITITKSDVGLGLVVNAGQDSTPIANSSNYVTSGGVKSYVDTATSILRAYPIGAIYISYNSTDPGELFGGSWTQLNDRFLLGAGTTYAARTTGGEPTHTLTESEIPSHSHTDRISWFDDQKTNNPLGANNYPLTVISSPNNARVDDPQAHVSLTGGSQAHNNMPPYLTVYMWRRVS